MGIRLYSNSRQAVGRLWWQEQRQPEERFNRLVLETRDVTRLLRLLEPWPKYVRDDTSEFATFSQSLDEYVLKDTRCPHNEKVYVQARRAASHALVLRKNRTLRYTEPAEHEARSIIALEHPRIRGRGRLILRPRNNGGRR